MASRLKKNLFFNITYQILILFLPLVTSSYLARIIGAEGIGRYSYAYSIALYFTYFTMLGLNKYGNRIIASVKNDKEKLSRNFCEIYSLQVICFICCFVLYILFSCFIVHDKYISLILSLFVLSSLFDVNWFFFGMEMFDKTVIRNTVVKCLTTILIFVFVKKRGDIALYAIIMAMGYLVSQLALWPYVKKYVNRVSLKELNVKKHLKPNLAMFLPVIAVSVYRILDKIMLGLMSSNEDVGYFENAEKIINVPIAIVSALGMVMLPRVTSLIVSHKDSDVMKYQDISMTSIIIFSVGAMFGLLGVSDILSLWLYGGEFEMSGVLIKYLSVTLLFLGMGNVVRTQFLIPYKYDSIYIASAFLGAVVNVVVNFFLIPYYHSRGAAIGTICAEAVVCLYQFYMVNGNFPITKYLKTVSLCIFVGGVMYVLMLYVKLDSDFHTLIIRILLGVTVYLGLCYILFRRTLKMFFISK